MIRFVLAAGIAAVPSILAAQATPATPRPKPIEITLSEWKVEMASDTMTAGPVTFQIKNEGNMNHAFYVLGEGVAKGTQEIAAKQSATLRLTLKPGSYEFYCPMSDQSHKMAGMTRKVTVVAAPKT
jgi:plastocyanin